MIGIFDSGLGGLSVLREVRSALPQADLLYVGDRARAPYGELALDVVRHHAAEIVDHLLAEGCSTVVVACNTASAAALHDLRRQHPGTTFVGMEPAVKPAAAASRSGTIGVLATPATFQSELFASLLGRHAVGIDVIRQTCDGWVELVERGDLDSPDARRLVAEHVRPVVAAGADVLVLGCTHFPFLVEAIRAVAGPDVAIVDPAPAVARQTARVAGPDGSSTTRLEMTGPADDLSGLVGRLAGFDLPVSAVTLRRT